ncbi:MAG: hypothetical protein ABEJ04_04470 [Halobacteriaceae archaeon]
MSDYGDRIAALADRARRDREEFEPSAVPMEERAGRLLREGVGPAVALYVEAHTGGDHYRFSPGELALLERAMNDWLDLYARCYGVRLDADFTVREAAELLVETRDVTDTAQLLTNVPDRQ